MDGTRWTIKAKEFSNCNCAYGCPCQFNALPTQGHCQAVVGVDIEEGHHGDIRLDGLKVVGVFRWPGPIHMGKGEAALVIDKRASAAQRESLLRILSGQDTEPGATIFQVLSTTLEKLHDPVFSDIDFTIDIDGRKAHIAVADLIESRGEPILNPVTGQEHRARIDMPEGFEYTFAEVGRGWSQTRGPLTLDLADSHGHFTALHLCESGLVR